MQSLKFDLEALVVDKTSHHSDLLERFALRLNPERIAAGYKPYSYARIAVLLAGYTWGEREELFIQCEKASNFGKYFNWRIKNKKI